MTDIAELGYKVDSSGLVEGTKALDENAAAAEKTGNAAARLEKEYQSMSRSVEQSSRALGDRLGGALDRIGIGTTSVVNELQTLNRTQGEVLAMLGGLEGRLSGAASSLQAYSAAGKDAVATEKQVATASRQLEQDIAAQEARFRSIAQQAVAYAESMRGANLSERTLAEAARESTSALNSRVAVMANAGTEQERMVARANALQQAEARTAQQAKEAARAAQAQELNLKKLLGQIDPTVAALNRLAEQEDRLAKARDLGLLKPQVFQQYQTQLETTRTKTLAAAQGTGTLTGQLGQLNLQSIETQQSVVALMRALATGDIGQAQSSIASLTARTGALSGVLTATGLAVGGTVAVIAALGVVSAKGYMEMRQLEGIVTATGNASGFTTGQLMNMRTELGRATGNYKDATAAISMLVSEGRASGQALEMIASSAMNLSALTGSSISSTVNEIEVLATGGADALVKLNDRYYFLTPEIYRHIEAVREQRGDYAATQAALERFEHVMSGRAQDMAESAGVVERAWKGALAAFRGTMEEIKSIGRNDLDSQIGRLKDDLAFFQTMQRSPIPGDARRGATGVQEMQKRIDQLSQWKQELEDGVKILGQIDQHDRDVVKTERDMARERAAADEALKGRLAGLDREASKLLARNKIIELYNKLDVDTYDIDGEKLPPDSRLLDGSMERLIARSDADIDKQFNRRDGVGKKNGDDSSAQAVLANTLRQIEANKQLVDTGVRVTESERQAMAIEQLLAKGKNTMTASTRALLVAARDELATSGQKAVAFTKEREAAEALARQQAIFAQAGSNRSRSNELDLMAMGGGSDAVAMLRRQLDIQREYQEELKRIGSRDVAKDKETWDLLAANADRFRNQELEKERAFQEQRMAMLGDWRVGAQVAWQNYAFDAVNYNQQAQDAVSGLLNTTTNSLATQFDAMIRGNQSLGDSISNIAVAMGNAVVGALEKMAAQWLVYQAVQLVTGRTAQAAAATGLIANAQATALQAQLAAYASTAAIPVVGPTMAPAAAAAAAGISQSYVASISAMALAGMAHDGIDSVPQDGTWLLQKGERVMTNQTSAKLDATLDRIASGGGAAGSGSGGNTYSPQIYINGDPDARTLQLVETAVRRGMTQTYDRVATEMATGQGRVAKGLRNGNTVQRRVR